MVVEIVRAGIDDLPLLMEWRERVLREVFDLLAGDDMASLMSSNRAYYDAHLRDGSHVACFARASQAIVGCGGICYHDELPSPDNARGTCGYLMNIYTLPGYRGMGVGRAVVSFLIADAMARGTQKIYLESSEAGRKLYRELGFTAMHGYMQL